MIHPLGRNTLRDGDDACDAGDHNDDGDDVADGSGWAPLDAPARPTIAAMSALLERVRLRKTDLILTATSLAIQVTTTMMSMELMRDPIAPYGSWYSDSFPDMTRSPFTFVRA